MPTSLSPINVCNLALSKIGAPPINSLAGSDPSSVQCNQAFDIARLEVSRSARWNFLLNPVVLTAVPQTPIPGAGTATPPSSTPWVANTFYEQGVYVSFNGNYYLVLNTYTSSSSVATDVTNGNLQLWNSNGVTPVNAVPWEQNTFYQAYTFLTYGAPPYYYSVNFTYTSSLSFINDLTQGALTQTNLPTNQPFFPGGNGAQYPSGWGFAYALPADFVLLCALNDNTYWGWQVYGNETSDYEIMGPLLYCDEPQAVIQYVKNQPDTTTWDPLFTNCVTLKLASIIATPLRQDGGRMEAELLQALTRALSEARVKNGGERQSRRFNLIGQSKFNAARYRGING